MEQEDKELLKDLCARLPYDVKGKVYAEVSDGKYDINGDMIFYDESFEVILDEINVSTEEIHVVAIGNKDTVEFIEFQQTDGYHYTIHDFIPYLRPMSSMTEEEKREYNKCMWAYQDVDFCNEHHLDYRGLIDKELALEAPEGMYNLEKK